MKGLRETLRKIYFWVRERYLISAYLEKRMVRKRYMPLKKRLGACGSNTFIEYPVYFDTPENVFLEEDVKIRNIARFVNSPYERITIKKYTVVGPDCMIISNNHKKTVGVPQFLLGASHIHDRNIDTTIGEDVWIGARVTIMPGANIGRGCIIGACSLVTKPVPPYAVVVGQPARIVGKVFEKKDIKRHESLLYTIEDRMNDSELDRLFEEYDYDALRTYGSTESPSDKEAKRIDKLKKNWRFVGIKSIAIILIGMLVSCDSDNFPGNVANYENIIDKSDIYHIQPYPSDKDTLRILAIGNSFSEDGTMQYLREMVLKTGIDVKKIGLYEVAKGAANFKTWIDSYNAGDTLILEKQAGWIYTKNQIPLREHLKQPWDIIVIQQSSSDSYNWDTFQDLDEYLDILTDGGKKKICIAYQLPWSHTANEMPGVLEGNIECCKKIMKKYGITTLIPSGTAIQLARQTELNDSMYLTRDHWHLNYGMGRYIAACTWFESLVAPFFGKSVIGNGVKPNGNYTDEQILLGQKCAEKAVKHPFNYNW